MALPKLKADPDAEQYLKLDGKKALLNGEVVEVTTYKTENRVGSYERGIRWRGRKYGILRVMRKLRKNGKKEYRFLSVNHGKTWFRAKVSPWDSMGETYKSVISKSKDKVILGREDHGELAFGAIQAINRRWEGPGYRWRP